MVAAGGSGGLFGEGLPSASCAPSDKLSPSAAEPAIAANLTKAADQKTHRNRVTDLVIETPVSALYQDLIETSETR
jgi:hypothetical protein